MNRAIIVTSQRMAIDAGLRQVPLLEPPMDPLFLRLRPAPDLGRDEPGVVGQQEPADYQLDLARMCCSGTGR